MKVMPLFFLSVCVEKTLRVKNFAVRVKSLFTPIERFLISITIPCHILQKRKERDEFIRKHAHEIGEEYAGEFYDKYN